MHGSPKENLLAVGKNWGRVLSFNNTKHTGRAAIKRLRSKYSMFICSNGLVKAKIDIQEMI